MVATIDPMRVPTAGNDVLTQTGAFVVLSGYNGNDKLTAGIGNDVFQEGVHLWVTSFGGFTAGQSYDLGLGNYSFFGGAGYDLLTIDGTSRAAVLDLNALTLVRDSEIDRFAGVEAFELGSGADVVTELMTGSLVAAGSGNDSVTGLSTGGFLDGGTSTDLLDLRLQTIAVDIDETFAGTVAGSEVHRFERVLGPCRPPTASMRPRPLIASRAGSLATVCLGRTAMTGCSAAMVMTR